MVLNQGLIKNFAALGALAAPVNPSANFGPTTAKSTVQKTQNTRAVFKKAIHQDNNAVSASKNNNLETADNHIADTFIKAYNKILKNPKLFAKLIVSRYPDLLADTKLKDKLNGKSPEQAEAIKLEAIEKLITSNSDKAKQIINKIKNEIQAETNRIRNGSIKYLSPILESLPMELPEFMIQKGLKLVSKEFSIDTAIASLTGDAETVNQKAQQIASKLGLGSMLNNGLSGMFNALFK